MSDRRAYRNPELTASGDIELKANRPALHDSTVLMGCDDNYFPFALKLAEQIATGHPDRSFDISILLSSGDGAHPLVDKLGLRVLKVQIPESWQGLPTDIKISLASYLRIIASGLLQQDYRKLLYLDSDMVYSRGDIGRLFGLDLGGRPVGAVLDPQQHRKPKRLVQEYRAAGLGWASYFNAGLMLIDVPAYVGQGIEAKAFEFGGHENTQVYRLHDQSLLNCALHGNVAELSYVWNWPSSHKYFFYDHFADPCISHFIGRKKPWNDEKGIMPVRYVRQYRNFFAKHFPDQSDRIPPQVKPGSKLGAAWRLAYVLHMINFRRMMKYLARFSEDYEVK